MNRREFLRAVGAGAAWAVGRRLVGADPPPRRTNVILCMADDLGWGDTGYNGHPAIQTPTLDEMSRSGLRFDRFYSGAPVCSPTRGSVITGRHPYRYGVFFANEGHMPRQEVTLAEVLKARLYATGHFGKWHLGTLTKKVVESNRGGPRGTAHYSPPWDNGFDVCFSTEAKVPTYNPMKQPGSQEPYGTHYWTGPEQMAEGNLDGDDSRVIMDRALPFIRQAAKEGKPFLAVIWFHAPHLPVLAGPEHRKPYAHLPEGAQHYLGCITALDEQVGRLRRGLRTLGLAEDTMLLFCSDNGPEGAKATPTNGSAGPLRGRKRSLYEGGIRVPGLLEWPARVKAPRTIQTPCSTCDCFPTVLDALGIAPPGKVDPIDGLSLLPLIDGKTDQRSRPIGFESAGQVALIDNRYKLIRPSRAKAWQLYDIPADVGEKTDLAAGKPDVVRAMAATLESWQASCKRSLGGEDYRP